MPMLRGPPSAGEQGRSRGPRGASAVAQAGSEGGWIQGSFSSQNRQACWGLDTCREGDRQERAGVSASLSHLWAGARTQGWPPRGSCSEEEFG